MRLRSAKAGDARARAALVRSLQDGWFRYALANLLSISAARDAAQETGLRVLRRLADYDPATAGPLDVWSLGAAAAAVRDVRSLNGDAPPLLAVARQAGLSSAAPRYRRQLTDAADGLTALLSPMTPDQRAAVALRLLARRPTVAVAAVLESTPAAVRADAAAGLATVPDRPLRPRLAAAREWLSLARYPGDLRSELFRADRPAWLVPAAVGSLIAGVVVLNVAHHLRPPAATRPATSPAPVAVRPGP